MIDQNSSAYQALSLTLLFSHSLKRQRKIYQ
uniref:Uncharacterized protein n=1 Tax=Arundo donax TaxID=35708 RepID=A0A0A8YVG8_ARUDO